ncbi:50S ribosomal protein L25 [bacterium]|nr:50S ribosomal protein L25 [bacterium]
MLTLSAKIRKTLGRKVKTLRREGRLPAVLYGPKIENLPLEIEKKSFEKIYKTAGESTLIFLEVPEKKKHFHVLIQNVQLDPITLEPLHVDFFQPSLKEKIEARIPLVFEGESKAVKDLGGTLVKHLTEIEVKALPQDLPPEIKVNIEKLKTFDDEILVKDLPIPEKVEVQRKPDEIVVTVSPPEKIEEELEKPIEEKVEEVEKVEEGKEEEIK